MGSGMSEMIRIKTISEVHEIFGLDKPKHPLVSVLPIDKRMTDFDYGGFVSCLVYPELVHSALASASARSTISIKYT